MAARSIIFSAPMIRALLDGRKSQTRRKLKPQPKIVIPLEHSDVLGTAVAGYSDGAGRLMPPRYGQPGDLVWVKETWQAGQTAAGPALQYRADGHQVVLAQMPAPYASQDWVSDRWRSSLFMPRWASRLTLRIISERIERLQDIPVEDALAEGMPDAARADGLTPQQWYQQTWNAINGDAAWDEDPWVCVLTFDVLRENIDVLSVVPGNARTSV